MILRDETPADIDTITAITQAAFADHPFSRQTEHFILHALRRDGALPVSLVAEQDGTILGHAAFSPVIMSDGTPDWYGLGPISVRPDSQRQGIGSALMQAGLARLKTLGARGCALVGDPRYYSRFGFASCQGLIYEGVPPEVFLVLPFATPLPQGQVIFHPAFGATS